MMNNNKKIILAVLMLGMAAQPLNAGFWDSVGGFFGRHKSAITYVFAACAWVSLFAWTGAVREKAYKNTKKIESLEGKIDQFNVKNDELNKKIYTKINKIQNKIHKDLGTATDNMQTNMRKDALEYLKKTISAGKPIDNKRSFGQKFNVKPTKKNFPAGDGHVLGKSDHSKCSNSVLRSKCSNSVLLD